ncbi:MAG: DNA mismatch repair protein MutS [Desulfococcaceae bacterium]
MTVKATPMLRQYREIKDRHPDAILFYRMGDFYEMFFEDAEIAARVLEITLTSRNKKDENPIPMCGVPWRAAQSYIARLIAQGYKVAICDQVEDPAQAKGIVKREVVRVVTPGMVVENEYLDARANNFVLAVCRVGDRFGLAALDISTAGFRVAETAELRAILDEVGRVAPAEALLPEAAKTDPDFQALAQRLNGASVSHLGGRHFEPETARELLLEQFGTVSLAGFGCEGLPAAVGAAGALLHYVGETQKGKLTHIRALETDRLDDYLWLNDRGCRNLELIANLQDGRRKGSLLDVIDRTVTAMGGRLLKRWLRYPLLDPDRINARLDAVAAAVDRIDAAETVRERLRSVYDLERLGSRIIMGHAGPRDLTALKQSLQALPEVTAAAADIPDPAFRRDADRPVLDESALEELADLIHRAIREDAAATLTEGGVICPGYSDELDELIKISKDGKGFLAELEARERSATGIGALKVRFNKVFGYYIEIPKAHASKVPAHYVRKQTLVNAERYITDDLKQYEETVLGAEERRAALEFRLFAEVRDAVREAAGPIQAAARFVARLDVLLNLAWIADRNGYRRPEIRTDGVLAFADGRHPVVETLIAGERFVPNTVRLDNETRQILIVTGPNMAGKSTVLRQVALMTILAQMGAFVPAREASVGVVDRIFTRVGALDNLSQGQSTFLVEMQETADILNNATPRSLVILDEMGRGTSTYDGLSIAWAVAEYLHELRGEGVKTLFATHYHELIALAGAFPRIRNFTVAVKEDGEKIVFLRKLVEGGASRSYGIQAARLAGIPDPVIRRAGEVLAAVEGQDAPPTPVPSNPANRDGRAAKNRGREPDGQLNLFSSEANELVQALKKIDITRMTPLDAMNCLNELQKKARFH